MAHIACVTTSLSGIVHASFELADRLRRAGHRVTLACPWDIREKVEAQGLDYLQLDPIDFDPTPPAEHGPADSRPRRILTTLTTLGRRRRRAVEAMHRRRFVDRLRERGVDMALVDMELHELVLQAAHRRMPFALLCQWFPVTCRPGVPPINTPLIPAPAGGAGPDAVDAAWSRERRTRARIRRKESARSLFADRRAILKRYARETGFPAAHFREYSWLQPFVYEGLPLFSLTDRALDFPPPAAPPVRYVGPMVHASRAEPVDAAVEARLRDVFRDAASDAARLVYCSVTTMHAADLGLLKRVAAVGARRPEWKFVIGLGGKVEVGALGPLPANVVPLPWAPQMRVLERADLSINHGGINTIHECIHFRVPMVVYSGHKHDQDGCAARIAYHGLGLVGDPEADGVDEMEASIQRVLDDPSFREAMEGAWTRYRAYDDDGVLPSAVDELLQQSGPG